MYSLLNNSCVRCEASAIFASLLSWLFLTYVWDERNVACVHHEITFTLAIANAAVQVESVGNSVREKKIHEFQCALPP